MGGMNENWLILYNRFVVERGQGVHALGTRDPGDQLHRQRRDVAADQCLDDIQVLLRLEEGDGDGVRAEGGCFFGIDW